MTRYNAITDGTEEVRETMETLIALQAGTIDLSGAPEEIKILPLGEVKSTKGTFLVDDASVDMILKSFKDRRIDLVVDYEHQTLLNVQAPASGWITELRKGADAIIGKVQWTTKAKEYLKNREYRYLSPTIMVRKDRRVSAVSSVALTNSPAIDGMPAMCKDNGLTKGENTMDLKKLIEVLGLAEDATEEDILKAVKKAAEAARASETPPADPPAEVVANSTILGLLDLPDTASTAEVSAKIVGLKNGDQQLALRVHQLEEAAKERETENLVQAAENASHTTLPRLIYGLGIAGIGLANAKMICRHFRFDLDAMRRADAEELCAIDGIGAVLADAWVGYFKDQKNNESLDRLLKELTLEDGPEEAADGPLAGKTFVITGSVTHFANRKALQERIEALGGKATGSVTSKTSYLINNDVTSNSAKNKKARELGIPILSEEDFLKMTEEDDHAH